MFLFISTALASYPRRACSKTWQSCQIEIVQSISSCLYARKYPSSYIIHNASLHCVGHDRISKSTERITANGLQTSSYSSACIFIQLDGRRSTATEIYIFPRSATTPVHWPGSPSQRGISQSVDRRFIFGPIGTDPWLGSTL